MENDWFHVDRESIFEMPARSHTIRCEEICLVSFIFGTKFSCKMNRTGPNKHCLQYKIDILY